uniref:Uncharacterized protein n=1 Tax=Arundo donax TaxID=35708 RepID=A0A0A9H1I6_ARUDO
MTLCLHFITSSGYSFPPKYTHFCVLYFGII